MLGIALALGSSVAWGISDFLGGIQSRRISALTVLLVSQPVGLVLALVVALAVGGDPLSTRDTAIAIGAGAAVVLALGAFYRAMALGSVSVVATIGALGVVVPIAGGLAAGRGAGRDPGDRRGCRGRRRGAGGARARSRVARRRTCRGRAGGAGGARLRDFLPRRRRGLRPGADLDHRRASRRWRRDTADRGRVHATLDANRSRVAPRAARDRLPGRAGELAVRGCHQSRPPVAGRGRGLALFGGHRAPRPFRARRAPGAHPARRGGDGVGRRRA